ncbi:putative Ferritin-like domain [Monocercomonoides exilis]|uniref:putative Ferritin-like domain n=1 Tax=Monocercomonoides exilis TaxID=2049356 RepID=UPI00355937DF|nr:putative Ferritin-like domain [Monocercomonoides exilis]
MPYLFKQFAKPTPAPVPPAVVEAICFQISKELYSQYLYNSMGACFQAKGLPGMARWMYKQAREEQEHAFKFMEWLTTKGQKVNLLPIPAPEVQWDSPVEVFKQSLHHEEYVTSLIHELGEKILPFDKEHPGLKMPELIKWFEEEQVEEEKSVADVIGMFEAVEKKEKTLEQLDGEIALLRQEKC